MKNYLSQNQGKGYWCCYPISLLNALIYYDKPYITSFDDSRWEKMVDKYCCRVGASLRRKKLIKELNLKLTRVDRDIVPDNLPVAISSFTKVGFHSSLVVETNGDKWTIINYNGRRGKLITIVDKNSIKFVTRGFPSDVNSKVEMMET